MSKQAKQKERTLITKWKLQSWKRAGNTVNRLESRLLTTWKGRKLART